MTVESEDLDFMSLLDIDLLVCPFVELCALPKHHFLCKSPDCKELCSEYLTKVKNLKL
ncbi:MAG: hypothetical protein ACXAAH_04285 [Promethearchaeota archaeon]|jgi:hypothetical protein